MGNGNKGSRIISLTIALILLWAINGMAQQPQAITQAITVEKDRPITRELRSGEVHNYTVSLAANQYFQAAVEQQGIDLVVAVFAPDGNKIFEIDSPTGDIGAEPVYLISEMSGLYRLEIRTLEKGVKPGKYKLLVSELRAASAKDQPRIAGYKLFFEADELSLERKPEIIDLSIAKFQQAASLFQVADDIQEVADTSVSIGRLYHLYKADYQQAEHYYQCAVTIYQQLDTPVRLAQALNFLGALNLNRGNYGQAETLFQQALAINERLYGADHLDVAALLNNLAALYRTNGDYVKAEPLYQRSLAIKENFFGPEHEEVALALSNLALFYDNKGDFARAEPIYQRALAIRKKILGLEHPHTAQSLYNLAQLYFQIDEYEKAEPLYQQALAIRQKVFGSVHPEVAFSLNSLGQLYRVRGDYVKAEMLGRQALAISEKVFGPDHPDVALLLNSLAQIYLEQGDFVQAESHSLRALAIAEKTLNPDHVHMVNYLANLALLYRAKGDIAQALRYLIRAAETSERELVKNLIAGSEREKLIYLNRRIVELHQTISLQVLSAPKDDQAARLALTTILRRKGRALDAMTDSIAILRRRANSDDQILLAELAETRRQYARLSLQGAGRAGREQYQQDLKTLESQIEQLEQQVSRRRAEFRVQSQPIDLTAVQQAIPANAVLVEFVAYRQFDDKLQPGQTHYVAYLLAHNGQPLFVDLGEAEIIDQAITRLRQYLPDGKSDIDKELKPAARALDQLVMQPVRKLLGNKKRLLISPDGLLNLVPFDALVDEQNNYLVEKYEISYLTSGRDLLRLQNGITSNSESVIIADPDFAEGPGPQLGDEIFNPLSRLNGTIDEANQIKTQLSPVSLLMQAQATKASLLSVSRPMVLHLATHGYFLSNTVTNLATDQRIAVRNKRQSADDSGVKPLNPLLRSGLFLANANSNNAEGILTALEVVGLDLWGTKLVVLSACDTGVGEVKSGDGVYGLRRALVLAGSETQLMSLWPISDQGTRDLMIGYYRALKNNAGRSAGLRQVRLALLKRPKRAHPYYWASFIPSGEWANLDGKR